MTVVVEICGNTRNQYDVQGVRRDVERHLGLLPPEPHMDATRIASALVGAVLSLETLTESGLTLERSKFELRQKNFDGEIIGRAAIIFHAKTLEKEKVLDRSKPNGDFTNTDVTVIDSHIPDVSIAVLNAPRLVEMNVSTGTLDISVPEAIELTYETQNSRLDRHEVPTIENRSHVSEKQVEVTTHQRLLNSEFGSVLPDLFDGKEIVGDDAVTYAQTLVDGFIELVTKKGMQEEARLTVDEVKHVSFLLGVRVRRTNKGYDVNRLRGKSIKEIRLNANRGKGSVSVAEGSVYSGLQKIIEYISPSTSIRTPAA